MLIVFQIKDQIERDSANQQSAGVSFEQLEAQYHENKARVVDILIENTMNVDIEIPKVVKGQFA